LRSLSGTVPTTARTRRRSALARDAVSGRRATPFAPLPSSALEDSTRRETARRALNIATALVGIVLTAPLMACIAVLVKVTSRGPVLYMQTRVGLDRRSFPPESSNGRRHRDHGGRPFTIYKFRTMRVQGNAAAQVWAQPDDPRVTSIGRVLRKYRLDELPQLFNVLRGDMNVVGPRPEQPKIFERLRQQIVGYEQRQRVRPGITGWAQINNHYDTSLDSVRLKVEYDLEYIARCSAIEDLRILIRTIPVVAFKRGAW
jgi:lipopolysaccharide/colanic/teichoic acid biosynthesis glycosyltransferase